MVNLLAKCWEAKQATGGVAVDQESIGPVRRPTVDPSTGSGDVSADAVLDLTTSLVNHEELPSPDNKSTGRRSKETTAEKTKRLSAEKEAKKAVRAAASAAKAAQKLAESEAKKASRASQKLALEAAKVEDTRALFRTLTSLLRSDRGEVWWVRILRYEPLILEDFTEWLRDTQEIVTDVDTVRDYMDWQGICVVKRVTRKGLGRKRF